MLRSENKLVSRAVWIELLRILACFCVILLHVSTKGWSYAGVDTNSWSVYEIFCAISRIGVCCFVMISGSLFLGNTRGQSIEKIYKKYIFKIVVLIAFWSCTYFVFRILNGNLKITSLKSVFGELLFGNYHLWYLWMIAGLYAVTPILNKIVEDNRLCRYFLILCAVVCWVPGMLEVVPALNKLVQGVLQDKMYLFLPAGYVGYYILGYYLCKNRLTDKQKNTILVAGLLGVAYAIIGGILYSQYTGEPSQATYNNLTLNITCYATAVFMIFKDKVSAIPFTEKAKRRIFALGKATLGIYLIHVMFVQGISDRFMVATSFRYPFASIPIAILIFICAYFVDIVIQKIPFVGKWIV